MAVLVTGGAGYIGSHTCVELLNEGEQIIIVDNFSNSKPEVLNQIRKITGKDFQFYQADLLNREAIKKIFSENAVESVIHFAGLKAVGESVSLPLRYYHNNITGTLILCEEMEAANVKRLVFSSSATVYGMNNPVPYREDMPTSATNPYGWTKVMIEQILKDLYTANPTFSISILRYFNPVGAHESGLIGEDPNGIPNNLTPYIAKVAKGELPKLTVYGDDYDTKDGTGVRDYIHVVDLAKGHLSALKKLRTETGVSIYNLGSGEGHSVLEVVRAYEKASGRPVPYVIGPRRAGDIASCYADPKKAEQELHWKATKSLYDMCLDSWRFTEKK